MVDIAWGWDRLVLALYHPFPRENISLFLSLMGFLDMKDVSSHIISSMSRAIATTLLRESI